MTPVARPLVCVAVLLTSLLAPLQAQARPNQWPTALEGRVVDRQGRAVPGICVDSHPTRTLYGKLESDVTDEAGRYRLVGTLSDYDLLGFSLVLRTCGSPRNVAPEWFRHAEYWEDGEVLTLYANRTTRQNVVLRTAAVIHGVVTSALGQPMAGVVVSTTQWGSSEERDVNATTDAAGRYVLSKLAPGKHRILATKSGVPVAASGGPQWLSYGGMLVSVLEGETKRVDLAVVGSS